MNTVRRALISVSNKNGILEFAKGLAALKIEIVSTGGTAKALKEANVPVREISDLTGFPEILDGRVKTLHPKVHGGILGIRENPVHQQQMASNDIAPIDMVVVNLYPFEETTAKPGASFDEIIENIDIGGPAMIRSAAKNFHDILVVVQPDDYGWVLEELRRTQLSLPLESKFRLAQKAIALTARYDSAISSYLSRLAYKDGEFKLAQEFPERMYVSLEKVSDLRYGENPHQKAAFYRELTPFDSILPDAKQLQGKELSFNNILDLNTAFQIAREFSIPCASIIKHTNPCGVGISVNSQSEAYIRARECDPLSAFGSVLGFNQVVAKDTAKEVVLTFVEAIIAPGYTDEALELLATKKNLRLIQYRKDHIKLHPFDYKRVEGGLLVQEADRVDTGEGEWKVVTRREPSLEEFQALSFAWRIVKHVKSNAIVYANEIQTVGIGAGQMSRVDSAQLGISKSRLPIKGCVMASDAFFPFRDGVDVAALAGIRAIIQPGGSLKDGEVTAAADEHQMAMIMTGMRHFKH